jgi:hypothetical protein
MKLKELILSNIKFVNKPLSTGNVINVKYLDEPFEFQIPKGSIVFIDHLNLMVLVTNNSFVQKIKELEQFLEKRYHKSVKSVFNDNILNLKFPYKFSKPMFKVYFENRQFNHYNLKQEDSIICLVTIDKLWISQTEINYYLNIKEVMLLKQ